ncbi:prolipoprotein diacylglyceryl transferase [Sutcliffiella sp. NPDC057660]|uniref:prolipoprotein diacylglyceryl transferase n=1 Tax=Sutcliffiella sp. NPDC057660 TaxID=3346199 RepID=UPI0036C18294
MNSLQAIDRVAFEMGPFTIYWYGIIIGIGVFLGWYLATQEAKNLGLSKDIFSDLLIWAIPIAIASARLYYVAFNLNYYFDNPGDIFAIWEGGIAIHGALLGGVIVAFLYTRKKRVSFWQLADIAAPSIILGQAIGRWGNFINKEAHGTEVSRSFLEGLYLPDFITNQMFIAGSYYHPTFLYESLWNLAGFGVLLFLRRLPIKRGEIFLSYLIWYSFGRFFVEGLRTDSLMIGEVIRTAQIFSLFIILLAIFLIWFRRKSGYAKIFYLNEYRK